MKDTLTYFKLNRFTPEQKPTLLQLFTGTGGEPEARNGSCCGKLRKGVAEVERRGKDNLARTPFL